MALAFIVSPPVKAQRASQASLRITGTHDTLTNADTVTTVLPVTAGYSAASVHVVMKKLTGSMGGSVKVAVSDDGATYNTVYYDTLYNGGSARINGVAATNSDTLTGTNSLLYTFTSGAPWTYIKITRITKGSTTAKDKTYYVFKRHD